MFRNEDCTMYFVDALLGVRDDPAIVSSLVLDSLYMWRNSGRSFSFLEEILRLHEQKLSTAKLEGILDALAEFRVASEIPELILDRVLALLSARLFGGERDDIGWVKRAFALLEQSFSVKRLEQLINLGIDHFPIPEAHVESFLKTIQQSICKVSICDPNFGRFASYQVARVRETDEQLAKKGAPRRYLDGVIGLLNDAVQKGSVASGVQFRDGIAR